MALDKPYLDVPGTTLFDMDQSRLGYHLNQFCMSLMKADNRTRFKADERDKHTKPSSNPALERHGPRGH